MCPACDAGNSKIIGCAICSFDSLAINLVCSKCLPKVIDGD